MCLVRYSGEAGIRRHRNACRRLHTTAPVETRFLCQPLAKKGFSS